MMRFKIPCVFFVMLLLCGTSWHRPLYAVSEKAKKAKMEKGEFKPDAKGEAMKKQYDLDNSKIEALKRTMKEARQRAQKVWIEANRIAGDFKHKFSDDKASERLYRSLKETVDQMKKEFNAPIDDARTRAAIDHINSID